MMNTTVGTLQEGQKVQKFALLVGVVLLVIKFAAYFLTRSNAILTDALESIINVVAGSFAFYSLWLAAKPQDENHPYGHGKIEFISAGVEGILIALAGIIIWIKAGYNLVHPIQIVQLDLGIALTALTGAVNYGVGWLMVRKGSRLHSLTLKAGGEHLQSDAYSSLGLVVGLALVALTRQWWLDNLVAFLFGGIIVWTGYRLVRRSVAGIMDEADYNLIRPIVQDLETDRSDNWIDVHNFRVIQYGATLHIDCHLTLPWYFNVEQAHQEVENFETLINGKAGQSVELFIHTDPCTPDSCQLCQKKDCPLRQVEMQHRVTWTLENIMKNQKHHFDLLHQFAAQP